MQSLLWGRANSWNVSYAPKFAGKKTYHINLCLSTPILSLLANKKKHFSKLVFQHLQKPTNYTWHVPCTHSKWKFPLTQNKMLLQFEKTTYGILIMCKHLTFYTQEPSLFNLHLQYIPMACSIALQVFNVFVSVHNFTRGTRIFHSFIRFVPLLHFLTRTHRPTNCSTLKKSTLSLYTSGISILPT